jgi:hypothetical protein
MIMFVTVEQLEEFRSRIEGEADLVEEMAEVQESGLDALRERFVHSEFQRMVVEKREAMESLAQGREAMRPLSQEWIRARSQDGLSDPEVESALVRLRQAFDRVRLAEDEIEAMATAYLARVGADTGSVEDRIRLHRSLA